MDAKEIALIRSALETLRKSANTTWSQGGFEEWVEYAKSMKRSISSVYSMISTLADSAERENKESNNSNIVNKHPENKETGEDFLLKNLG